MNKSEILQIAKPILFNTEMVRAILDGRKTVTRRCIKPQPEGAHHVIDCDHEARTFDFLCGNGGKGGIFVDWVKAVKAPFWPCDILYVRETWGYGYDGEYIYKADDKLAGLPTFNNSAKLIYRPSIHMPKEAARIFLRVTDVNAEKLQDLRTEDCLNEGIIVSGFDLPHTAVINQFKEIWNSTIKKDDLDRYGWDANPWVWVIEFEKMEVD